MNAPILDRRISYLREISSMLGWRSYKAVAMLWGFFDESYDHDKTSGHATWLTMGGCFAPADAWLRFAPRWIEAINQAQVSMFHMADFEASKGEFNNWKICYPEKREKLLNELLDLVGDCATAYIGVQRKIHDGRHADREAYRAAVLGTIKAITDRLGGNGRDKIAVVFARHKSMSLEKAEAFRAVMDDDGQVVGPLTIDDPQYNVPLQAADIVAYEMSRRMRSEPRDRYPLQRLKEAAIAQDAIFETHLA